MYQNLNTDAKTIAQWASEAKVHATDSKSASSAQKITAMRVTILFVQFLANHYAGLDNKKKSFQGLLEHARLSIYAAFGTAEKTDDQLHFVRNRVKVLGRQFTEVGMPPMADLILAARRIYGEGESERIDVDRVELVKGVIEWRKERVKELKEIAAKNAEKVAQANKSAEAQRIADLENEIAELKAAHAA